MVEQPEFEICAVRRAFEQVLKRPVHSGDQELFDRLVGTFRQNGHRWRPILRSLLASRSYLARASAPQVSDDRAGAPPPSVPPDVKALLSRACARCHDADHRLDLRQAPAATDTETWKRILTEVSDYSMPPPVRDGDITRRFPLDPSVRKRFTAAVARMLGSPLATPVPPRRMPHDAWLWITRRFAEPLLGDEQVELLLSAADQVRFAKLPPRGLPPVYQLAIQQTSEAICRGVARARGEADDRARAVAELLRGIYGMEASPVERSEALALLRRFEQVAGDRGEAWAALCSTHLSGPKLLFGAYW